MSRRLAAAHRAASRAHAEIAAALEAELRPANDAHGAERFYDGENNPIGKTRALKNFCKKRGIPMHLVGSRLVAKAADVDAAITKPAQLDSTLESLFAEAVAPRTRRGPRKKTNTNSTTSADDSAAQ